MRWELTLGSISKALMFQSEIKNLFNNHIIESLDDYKSLSVEIIRETITLSSTNLVIYNVKKEVMR